MIKLHVSQNPVQSLPFWSKPAQARADRGGVLSVQPILWAPLVSRPASTPLQHVLEGQATSAASLPDHLLPAAGWARPASKRCFTPPRIDFRFSLQGVLGEQALSGASVPIHPFLIAGWAGLVSTALNLLPVGNIDGGRVVQVRPNASLCSAPFFAHGCCPWYQVLCTHTFF